MNGAFEIGQTGLVSLQRALDILANNVTNINTQGFKRSDVRFSEVVAGMSVPGIGVGAGTRQPSLAGVSTTAMLMVSQQGEFLQTGGSLDLAIEGDGFFELMGPNGELYLSRGGTLSVAEGGALVAQNGMELRDRVSVPLDAQNIEITRNGLVSAIDADGQVIELGEISLVRSLRVSDLERMDGGIYRVGDDSALISGRAGEDGFGQVVQGALERSNVELNKEMIDMMIVQRAYAANAQIVQAADQLMSIANNLRR